MNEVKELDRSWGRLYWALSHAITLKLVHENSRFAMPGEKSPARATLISTDQSTTLVVSFRPGDIRIATSRPVSSRVAINSADDLHNHIESLKNLNRVLERLVNRAEK